MYSSNAEHYSTLFHIYLMRDGNTEKAWEVIKEASLNNISFEELSKEALYTTPIMLEIFDGQIDKGKCYPKSIFMARIYNLLNRSDRAKIYFDSARVQLETMLLENTDNPRYKGKAKD